MPSCTALKAALRFGQSVQRVPQIAETLHAFQQLLRGRLGQASGVFDAIVTVERILCLVADHTPLIGSLIQLIGPQLGGHFIGNFNIFIMGIPSVKVLQIDSSHYIFLRSDFCDRWRSERGMAEIGSRGRPCPSWDNLSQGRYRKTRLHGVMPHKRVKRHIQFCTGKFRVRGRTAPQGELRFF